MGQNRTQNQVFCYFFKLGSLVFLEIAYNDNQKQYLTCSRGKIQEKFVLGQRGQNWSRNQVFCHFLKFGSLIFLEIACNDSLQQCLTCSRDKIHEKIFGPKFLSKGATVGPETRFFTIFLTLIHQFSLKLHTMIACNNV